MTRRRSIVGIVMVFVVALSAFAASTASAAPGVAFTCSPVTEGRKFSDEHCVTAASGAGNGFVHATVKATPGEPTEIGVTNEKAAGETKSKSKALLRGKLSGLETELECETVGGMGSLTQNTAEGAAGTGTLNYSGCVVLKPAGRECKVAGGVVNTNTLKATTVGRPNNNELKFEPNTGTEFAGVTLEKCKENKPPNTTYPVSGSVVGTTTGATTCTTEEQVTTVQKTLTFGGNPAGLEGCLTLRMGTTGNPLVLT